MGKFKQDFDEAVDAVLAGGEWSPHKVLYAAGSIFEVGTRICAQIGGDDGQFNELIADMEAIYDERIAPIDLPIPDAIELGLVDPLIRQMIRPAMEAVRPKP